MYGYSLPVTIDAGGQELPIRNKGDWRMCIDVNLALTDILLDDQERFIAALIIFYDYPIDEIKDVNSAAEGMVQFLSAGIPDDGVSRPSVIDWEDDASMIVSGINSVIGREVRAEPYMHWWTFIAAYMAIGDSTLATVVGIRDKIANHKKLEKHEEEFRRKNPGYFRHKRQSEANKALMLEIMGEA